MADERLLHIYGQEAWHDEAYLVGNRQALKALRDALTMLVDRDEVKAAVDIEVFANDGEGYSLSVVLDDSPWEERKASFGHPQGSGWMLWAPPYIAKYARRMREGTIHPAGEIAEGRIPLIERVR